ncbi:MAG: TetR/AcrR family transcriptional regulator [Syntrophobacterales bacterium]|jgi:AcrR family transcriptional regulator
MDPSRTTKKEVVAAFRTNEILAATRRLMEQKGVDSLTMDEIAQAAGVAKGTIYLYFQSKDELIRELLSQVGEAIALDLEGILAKPDPPPEKLQQVINLLLNYVDRESALFPVYLRELVRSKSGGETALSSLQELEERNVALITQVFAEGITAKQFIPANPRLLTFLLKGLIRAVGYYQMTRDQKDTIQEALPVVLTFLFSGIVLEPETASEEATV